MADALAIIAIVFIIGGAVFYIIKAKKSGQKCIGCPYAKKCTKNCSCNIKDDNH